MMTGIVMFLHAIVSILLIIIILMQSGRGGGLTEGFASAESMFGAQTNEILIKATSIFAAVFLVMCLGLALLSAQKGRSLMSNKAAPAVQQPLPAVLPDVVVGEEEPSKGKNETAGGEAAENKSAGEMPTVSQADTPPSSAPAADAIPGHQ